MKLSQRLEAAAAEVFAREIKNKAAPDDHFWFVDATTSNLLLEAAALAKSVESATAGELFVSRYDVRDFALADADGQLMVMSHLEGHRVALVPLPQQSET